MHFEILVEDQSGKTALDTLVPGIIGAGHTFTIHSYKGVGHIPGNMRDALDPSKRILLSNLPKLLKGYGRTFAGYGSGYAATVVLVCDLDDRDFDGFLTELTTVLNACNPRPNTRFCLAIEEGEAWLLGDRPAIKAAYPTAIDRVLDEYVNDSICGTWETLADAVYPGGAHVLEAKGWKAVGAEKSKWAEGITSHMDVETNNSPSFQFFRDVMRELSTQ